MVSAKVLGIGVAVIERRWGIGLIFNLESRQSLARCSTPNRCCSSNTTRAKSPNFTLSWIKACVPIKSGNFPFSAFSKIFFLEISIVSFLNFQDLNLSSLPVRNPMSILKLLSSFKIDIGFLTGKEDKFRSWKLRNETIEISRKKILEKAENGKLPLLIGTHALIQDKVKFGDLALVVLDEQHLFGVEQRAKLCRDSRLKVKPIPHLLSMTATPIPRTLALTIYGDLDLSLISELPKGRKKIITKVIPPGERQKAYAFIKKEIRKNRQVFVICPRIEVSNKKQITNDKALNWSEAKAVKEEYEKLDKTIFPELKIGMLHGKMKVKEKENIMRDFKNKKMDILVSTSVIEVGIDVPNATVMLIEGAERFGLAQLHQFRGRVGRSKFQSYCFLFADSPAKTTRLRLKALLEAEDGFKLAEKDLEIRGPGALDGKRQWGIPDLLMSSLKDIALVEKTRIMAKELLESDFELKKYPLLKERIRKFRERIHLE